MRKTRRLMLGLILVLVGITGIISVSSNQMSIVGMMDSSMMRAMLPPGIAQGDLPEPQATGARLLSVYCTQCHELPAPGMHMADEWPEVINRMNVRMQEMGHRHMIGMMYGINAPDDNEIKTLLAYLQNNAQVPIDSSRYDLNTLAARKFRETCSQCHALPEPSQLTASEWVTVVERMKKNMELMGKPIPGDQEFDQIIKFLNNHAKTTG